jgi:hypothetical protein
MNISQRRDMRLRQVVSNNKVCLGPGLFVKVVKQYMKDIVEMSDPAKVRNLFLSYLK